MIIGVPKEIKTKETRVSVTPSGVKTLTQGGHKVFVETNAGVLSGFSDEVYKAAGADIVDAGAAWGDVNMVVKVKEPLEDEYKYFRSDLTIFTYLHLAGVPSLVKSMCESGVRGIGYETVETSDGGLPLLRPMSEVAGRIASQVGTYLLHRNHGGKGLLLGGVTGTNPGTVVVIGGGWVGLNAAEVAAGLRANTVILDISDEKLKYIEDTYKGKIKGIKSTPDAVNEWSAKADLFVGAVLVAGDRAPHVLKKDHIKNMEKGSVVVDVSIDQGGCIETSKPTSHEKPTFELDGIIHYAVPNMPALTPRTSTEALTTATFPYVEKLAGGVEAALNADPVLKTGLQTENGKLVYEALQKLFPDYA